MTGQETITAAEVVAYERGLRDANRISTFPASVSPEMAIAESIVTALTPEGRCPTAGEVCAVRNHFAAEILAYGDQRAAPAETRSADLLRDKEPNNAK